MLAITAAFKAFLAQAKSNHIDYCRKVVKNADEAKAKSQKPAKKSPKKKSK